MGARSIYSYLLPTVPQRQHSYQVNFRTGQINRIRLHSTVPSCKMCSVFHAAGRQLASLSQLTSFGACIHTPHTPLQLSFIVKVSNPAPRLNNTPLEATIRRDLVSYSLSKGNFTSSFEDLAVQIVRILCPLRLSSRPPFPTGNSAATVENFLGTLCGRA